MERRRLSDSHLDASTVRRFELRLGWNGQNDNEERVDTLGAPSFPHSNTEDVASGGKGKAW
jgi:hypothetical protein